VQIACPACGKSQPGAGDNCQRCGCELRPLREVLRAAARLAAAAAARLRAGQYAPALALAERSWRLKHSQPAALTAFLAALSGGPETGVAGTWLARLQAME
jgi:hypothetical protein